MGYSSPLPSNAPKEKFVSNFPNSHLPTAETYRYNGVIPELSDAQLSDNEVLEIEQGTREGYRELRNIGVPQRFYYVDDDIFVRENGLLQHPTYPTFKKEPWYPRNYDYQAKLDIFTGNNLKPMLDRPQKKENPPLYKPWKEPNLPDKNFIMRNVLNQSHRYRDETSTRARAFETPTETIKVPPGLNKGYTAQPDDRPFHPWFRAEPKTIDELRGWNRPSFAVETTTPGWASGSQMRAETRRVDPKRKEAVYGLDERRILPQLGSFRKPSKFGDVYLATPPRIDKAIEYFGSKVSQNFHPNRNSGVEDKEGFDQMTWNPTRADGRVVEFEGRNVELGETTTHQTGEFMGSKRKEGPSETDLVEFLEGRANSHEMRNNQMRRAEGTQIEHPYKQDRMSQMRYMTKGYLDSRADVDETFRADIVENALLKKSKKRIEFEQQGLGETQSRIMGKGSRKENLMLKAPKSYYLPLDFEDQYAKGNYEFANGEYDNNAQLQREPLKRDLRQLKNWDYVPKIRTDGSRQAPNNLQLAGYKHNNPMVKRTKKEGAIAVSRFGNGGSNLKGVSNNREHMGVPVGLVPKRLIVSNETRPPTCCQPKKTTCDPQLYGRQTRVKSNRLANDAGPMPLNRNNPYEYINRAPAQTVVKPRANLKGTIEMADRTMYKPFDPPVKAKKANFF